MGDPAKWSLLLPIWTPISFHLRSWPAHTRDHRTMESRVHYVRAVTFKENARRTRTEVAPAVLGALGPWPGNPSRATVGVEPTERVQRCIRSGRRQGENRLGAGTLNGCLLGWIRSIWLISACALWPLTNTIRPVWAAQYWPVESPCQMVHPRFWKVARSRRKWSVTGTSRMSSIIADHRPLPSSFLPWPAR